MVDKDLAATCPSVATKKEAASVCQRPKSREETPKEGGGNTSHRATAPPKYVIAAHKMQDAGVMADQLAEGFSTTVASLH
jgi:hypothetical protein